MASPRPSPALPASLPLVSGCLSRPLFSYCKYTCACYLELGNLKKVTTIFVALRMNHRKWNIQQNSVSLGWTPIESSMLTLVDFARFFLRASWRHQSLWSVVWVAPTRGQSYPLKFSFLFNMILKRYGYTDNKLICRNNWVDQNFEVKYGRTGVLGILRISYFPCICQKPGFLFIERPTSEEVTNPRYLSFITGKTCQN